MEILPGNEKAFIDKPSTELVQQEQMEYKFFGEIRLTPGLKLFEFNYKEGTITEVQVESYKTCQLSEKDEKLGWDESKRFRTVINPHLIYFEALNMKSAIKRVERYLNGKLKRIINLKSANNTIGMFNI